MCVRVCCDVSASSAAPTPRVSDDDPLAGVTQGLTSLSRTQSELKARWHAMKKADSQKAAPTKVPGVHQDALPSYAAGAVAHVSFLAVVGGPVAVAVLLAVCSCCVAWGAANTWFDCLCVLI